MTFVRRIAKPEGPARGQWPEMTLDSFDSFLGQFMFGGNNYGVLGGGQLPGREEIARDYASLARNAFKSNAIVFSCIAVRMWLLSEIRFQFRSFNQGRPGGLFGTPALLPLEKPWTGGTTGDLVARASVDVDIAGNSFTALRPNKQLRRLRPDWVDIVLGSYDYGNENDYLNGDIDIEVVGYLYYPGGRGSGKTPVPLLPEEVAHIAPIPDPDAHFRGVSWLNAVLDEILGDKAAMAHKETFYRNGGSPRTIVVLNESTPEKFDAWVEKFKAKNGDSPSNAYKTFYLGAGADAKVIGSDFKQLDFQVVIQGGETRIAAAAGVHPIIAGFESGLEGSTLNQGNFTAAKKRLADGTLRPWWRNASGSFANIIEVPDNSELWYDPRDIAFLQQDEKDAADRRQSDAVGMRQAIEAGWVPTTVRDAWLADDMSLLVHSGRVSVQLQDPSASQTSSSSQNGNGPPSPAIAALTP